jgi:hypothetical protein
MTGRIDLEHHHRRSRIVGASVAGAASLATLGLVVGITHVTAAASEDRPASTTTTSPTGNGASTETTQAPSRPELGRPDRGTDPQAGSNGS